MEREQKGRGREWRIRDKKKSGGES